MLLSCRIFENLKAFRYDYLEMSGESFMGKAGEMISDIYKEHAQSPLMLNKAIEYLGKQLPDALRAFAEREERKDRLSKGSEEYIDGFLSQGRQYLYVPLSELFIIYDGIHYKLTTESQLVHAALSGISSSSSFSSLIPWKHKIKNLLVRRVKGTSPLATIPESDTIQFVLSHISPTLFQSREEGKYFLTVIGDSILKKATELVHFISPTAKPLIMAIQGHVRDHFKSGVHANITFKHKYYDHRYPSCRILNCNESAGIRSCWDNFIKTHILDIVVVSTHYSRRYGSGDNFLKSHCRTDAVKNRVRFLADMETAPALVSQFLSGIETGGITDTIDSDEMHYLWFRYLSSRSLPHIISRKNLKDMFMSRISYDPETDRYCGLVSPALQKVHAVQSFWNATIEADADDELDISEFHSLMRDWSSQLDAPTTVDEEDLLPILSHFYLRDVSNCRHLVGIVSSVWDKRGTMRSVIEELRIQYAFQGRPTNVSMYRFYRDYVNTSGNSRVVSKRYFEKYINRIIDDQYIQKNRILSTFWLNEGS